MMSRISCFTLLLCAVSITLRSVQGVPEHNMTALSARCDRAVTRQARHILKQVGSIEAVAQRFVQTPEAWVNVHQCAGVRSMFSSTCGSVRIIFPPAAHLLPSMICSWCMRSTRLARTRSITNATTARRWRLWESPSLNQSKQGQPFERIMWASTSCRHTVDARGCLRLRFPLTSCTLGCHTGVQE